MSPLRVLARLQTTVPALIGGILVAFSLFGIMTELYPAALSLGLGLGGLWLSLAASASVSARRIQFVLAVALVVLGVGTLFCAVDTLAWRVVSPRVQAFLPPVGGALALLLAGVSCLLIAHYGKPTCRILVELFALAVSGVGVFDVIGNVFHFASVVGWYARISMPLGPAIACAALGVGLWLHGNSLSKPRLGLRQDAKIIATSGAVMVITLVVAAALGFMILARQTEQVLRDSLAVSLHARSTVFAHEVAEAANAAHQQLREPAVRRLLTPQFAQAWQHGSARARASLLAGLARATEAETIEIRNERGQQVGAYPAPMSAPSFRYRLPGPDDDELIWRGQLLLRVNQTLGVRDDRLVVAFDFRAAAIMPIVTQVSGLGDTGVLFVCMEVGANVSCLPSRVTRDPVTVPWSNDGKPIPMHYALHGQSGVIRSIDYRHQDVIAAYAPVGDLGLGAVIKMDRDELYRPIYRQLERVLAVVLLLIVAGTLLLRRQVSPLVRELLSEIEERRRAEGELRKLSVAVEQSASMVMIANREGVIEYVNSKVTQVTGYRPDELIGKTPRIFKSGYTSEEQYRTLWEALVAGKEWRGEFQNRKKNGELYWVFESISPIRNEDGVVTHYLSVDEDVTARKEAEQRLNRLAHFDGLTGLPNRELFRERLSVAMADAGARGREVALMFLDLDRFKTINDTLGHAAGDSLLCAVSERIQNCVRRGDTIARLGGDEFTIVLADMAQAEDASVIARKILEALREPFRVNERELFVTASIGVTLYPSDSRDVDTLITNADVAMYRAKERGRNNYQFYTSEMNARAVEQLALENDLRRAVEAEEFELHYQPQFDLRTGAVMGAEALIRWRHRELGMISPAQFIPLAEEMGLITAIGQWVVRAACEQVRAWRDAGLPRIRVSINLSARQFATDDLPALIARNLAASGIDAEDLGLELTEGLLMENAPAAVRALEALSNMGLEIAIDDFGMGYSSLSYLRRFRIDVLKIDQSFVRDLHNTDGASIVNAIVLLGHGLGLRVIAEGVETSEQLAYLRARGCDAAQGYYYSRPLSVADFAAFMRGRPATAAPALG